MRLVLHQLHLRNSVQCDADNLPPVNHLSLRREVRYFDSSKWSLLVDPWRVVHLQILLRRSGQAHQLQSLVHSVGHLDYDRHYFKIDRFRAWVLFRRRDHHYWYQRTTGILRASSDWAPCGDDDCSLRSQLCTILGARQRFEGHRLHWVSKEAKLERLSWNKPTSHHAEWLHRLQKESGAIPGSSWVVRTPRVWFPTWL